MDKLKYDSFYKFLVSLGIILITLPFAGLIYIANFKVTLIDAKDYEQLSEYSQSSLEQKERFFNLIDKYSLCVILISLFLGCLSLIIGGIYWFKMQRLLDKQLHSDTIKKQAESDDLLRKLSAQQASPSETLNEKLKEVEAENAEIENNKSDNSKTSSAHDSNNDNSAQNSTNLAIINASAKLIKYFQIEETVCKILSLMYSQTHNIKNQVRINNYIFDAIAVAKNDDNDIIFEIKYYKSPHGGLLRDSINRTLIAKSDYETVYKRSSKLIYIIVTPKDNIKFKKYIQRQLSDKNVSCEFWAEEDLFDNNN